MHTIAKATGGTFSFIDDEAAIQDAFVQCIGGLLSVTVQELRLDIACVHPGVRLRAVKSGSYGSHIDADGRCANHRIAHAAYTTRNPKYPDGVDFFFDG
jgi:hypothetical protein